MTEMVYEPETGIQILNETDVDTDAVFRAFAGANPEMAAMVRWTTETKGASRRGGLFERDRYITPVKIFDQIAVARDAGENDDVVSGVIEATEALAFNKMSIDCDGDEEQSDIWNQIAADLDLDSRLREMWREDFTISQVTVAVWWGSRDYKVHGTSSRGIARKKIYNGLRVPVGLTIIDPLKVIPVGTSMFNQDQLAYVADRGEADVISRTLNGFGAPDPIIEQLITSPYEPSNSERMALISDGLPTENLWLLNSRNVWRHTSTRSQYRRFPEIRMKSIFELLDLKHQLRSMDRAVLIGSSNFIVLIKKGTDEQPAKASEIENLQGQVRTMARVPVIVGDHRLSIEIVTPKNDNTLQPDRYNGLDARISARLWQVMMTGNFCLTPDHDVLVRTRGWVPIDEVKIGEEVASWKVDPDDHSKGITIWSPVADAPGFHYEGKMLDARTGPSFCATPNHMMRWRGNAGESAWRWGRVDELRSTQRVPAPNTPLPGLASTISADEMELYGWWIAEGSGRIGRMTRFTQVNLEGRTQLFELLDRMGIRYRVYGNEIRTAWEPAHHVGLRAGAKYIPRALMDEEHIDRLLVGLVRGDGSWRREGWSYATSSSELARDVQELGTRLGYRTCSAVSKTTHLDAYRVSGYPRPEWSLNLRFEDTSGKNGGPQNARWVDYAGMVYCLTVPETGTFVVRRNGQVHVTGNSAGAKGDDSLKLAKFIAKGIENRRHLLRRSLERWVLKPTMEANEAFTVQPKLRFHPKRVALDFDSSIAGFLMDLRDRGDLSRESILEELDFDQAQEFLRRQTEAEKYDDVFQTISPWGKSGAPPGGGQDPKSAGRNLGGNRNGGGAAPGTGQGQAPRNPAKTSDGGPQQ